MGDPQNDWFIREHPNLKWMMMDDDWGYPHLWKLHIYSISHGAGEQTKPQSAGGRWYWSPLGRLQRLRQRGFVQFDAGEFPTNFQMECEPNLHILML